MFYCVVGRIFLHTFYFRSGKKYCCTVICGHSSFYWIVSRWADENGFERKRNFMIQISNLSKKYGETVVFSDLNYTFENACIYGLVGRNGAGKTTLLNILSNYEKNYTGVISIDRKKMNKVWMPIQSIIIFTAKNRLQRLLYILPFYILSLLPMRVWQMLF